MGRKLFVGNLPFEVNDADLIEIFSQIGPVVSARVVYDNDRNQSKGFGFVEMDRDDHTQLAVERFNGCQLNDRILTVAVAKPQPVKFQMREVSPRRFGG